MGKILPEKVTRCQHQFVNSDQLCLECIAKNDTIDEIEPRLKQAIEEASSKEILDRILRKNSIVEDNFICVIPEHYYPHLAQAISAHIKQAFGEEY